MKRFLLLTAVLSLLSITPVYAVDDNPYPSPWRDGATYGDQAIGKLGYGLKNTLLGWTELFTEPVEYFREDKSPLAIGQGLGNAVMDTIGGVLHLLTFPLTEVDVPLPENGVSLLADE